MDNGWWASFARAYGKRFFSEIKVLALTAESETIRKRMTEGRGIDDAGWIQSSWIIIIISEPMIFWMIQSMTYNGTPAEIARKVLEWLSK